MVKMREVRCRSAINKTNLPGGGWTINPYVGCEHACVYCYARFMKRFTGHVDPWGSFVDVRTNIVKALTKQIKSAKYLRRVGYLAKSRSP